MEIRMSTKEADRLEWIRDIDQGRLSREEGARLLGISKRQLRRILGRYRKEGPSGLVHRSRGVRSNRRIPDAVRDEVLALLQEEDFHDYGPTLFSETVAEELGHEISRETIRQWMVEQGHWTPRKAKATHRQWRERKACYGQMLQMDTSIHDWFEGRGEEVVLIAMIDDATSRLYCRFFSGDTTAANMTLLRDYIRRYGRPRSLYVDKASHFMVSREPTPDEQRAGKSAQTQIQRALEELDIEHITAHSPQAKGRVERCFRTLQDRLIKKLRRAKIHTIEEANAYLEEVFLPLWEQRFTQEPREAADVHRRRKGLKLDAIFSHQETRRVADDYTFSYKGQHYQILKESVCAGLRRSDLVCEERLDGTFKVCWRGRYLRVKALPGQASKRTPSTKTQPRQAPTNKPRPKPAHNHPWKRRAIPLAADANNKEHPT